ncbi:MAG: HAMP domain-containing histidine kinase [Actinobacteria bacterium]|nr:HAMP domain-containing histidine kinase [Actinomycetota bacterium]
MSRTPIRATNSLRTRLLAAVAVAVAGAVALTLVVAGVLVRDSVRDEAIASLGRQAELLVAQRGTTATVTPTGSFIRLSSAEEETVAVVPRDTAAFLIERASADIAAGRPAQGSLTLEGQERWFAARASGEDTLVLLRRARIDWPLWPILMVAGLAAAALATLVAWLLARGVARPIGNVAAASDALAGGAHPDPLPVRGPSEVRALSGAFNNMADELSRMRDAERAFLLSVSHELKTPLTAIRGNAEALADGVVTPEHASGVLIRESRRLQRLVQDLLDLARLNVRTFSVRRDRVDLDDLALEVVERYAGASAGFAVDLVADLSRDGATALADHDRLLQVVSNLVENALRSTPTPGRVTVVARAAAIEVSDTGPGISAEDLPHAFERFYLHDRSARENRAVGSGLGLAVVKELTEAMGGQVRVTAQPGGGTRFELRLPEWTPAGVSEGHREAARAGTTPPRPPARDGR